MSRANSSKKQRTEPAPGCSKEKTQTVKHGIPLDDHIAQHLKSSHHVLRVVDEVWDAKLNMSNSAENNNKFYIIQILESDQIDEESYYVWNRWGRVGKFWFKSVI